MQFNTAIFYEKKAPTINRRGFSAFINLFQLIIS